MGVIVEGVLFSDFNRHVSSIKSEIYTLSGRWQWKDRSIGIRIFARWVILMPPDCLTSHLEFSKDQLLVHSLKYFFHQVHLQSIGDGQTALREQSFTKVITEGIRFFKMRDNILF